MIDREKVISNLSDIYVEAYDRWVHCQYAQDKLLQLIDKTLPEALFLLRKREPHYTTLEYLVNGTKMIVHHPECPRCFENGLAIWDAEIERGQAYCKRCGQAVKWDD